MVVSGGAHTDTLLPIRVFADAYKLVRGIEAKLKLRYPEAEFDLLCGPDEVLHLKVYTDGDGPLSDVLDLVDDDLVALEDKHDLTLYVVPLRLQDREDCHFVDKRDPSLLASV